MTDWDPDDLGRFEDLPRNRLADFAMLLAGALICGSIVAAADGLISAPATVALAALTASCCLLIEHVASRP